MAGSAKMSDVAQLAGVSTMTVSRVLNGNPNVTEAVRKRVVAATKKLRYHRNELARSLRAQRTRQIGVLVPNLYDPFFATCAHFVNEVARQHGYSVVLATSDENPDAEYEEACRMLRRNVEGLIMIPARPHGKSSQMLGREFADLTIVTLDRPIENGSFDSVLADNERGSQIGTAHLIQHGHKRIAYVGLSDDLYTMRERHAGYALAMADAGLRQQAITVADSLSATQKAIARVFAQKRPPTALFCATNLITRHVLHSLQALSLRLPTDVALVGFDDFETADLLRPGITVVRQPLEQLSRTAAENLFKRLNSEVRPRSRGEIRRLPVELVVRESCGSESS